MTELLYDASRAVDPLGDADAENEKSVKHNRAKVGSSRPSSLLYTYGPGAIMDLPQFTIMPTGLDNGTGSGTGGKESRRASTRRGCAKRSGRTCAPPSCSFARSRGSRSGTRSATRGSISASRPACSRSGYGAPAATCSAWCPSSATSTLIRTGPTRPASSTRSAPAAAGPGKRPVPPSGQVPARLRDGTPGRVPVRPLGAPGPHLREGRDPVPEDDRQDRGQGRVGDIRCESCKLQRPMNRPRARRAPRSCLSAGDGIPTWTRSSPADAVPRPS